MPGFSLRIFLADGNPDGLRIVQKSHWTGVVVMVSRQQLASVLERPEFQATGVYILRATDVDSGMDKVYVGEGDVVATRIVDHDKKKDWWDEVVVVTKVGQSLNKADVRFLEARLIENAKTSGLADVDNTNSPKPPDPPEADLADLQTFLADVLTILPVLGIRSFEIKQSPSDAMTWSGVADSSPGETGPELFLKVGTTDARGYSADDGFWVRAASKGSADKISMSSGIKARRQALIDAGLLTVSGDGTLSVASDVRFRSPNQAASVLYGTNLNGRKSWKNDQGVSLGELDEEILEAVAMDMSPLEAFGPESAIEPVEEAVAYEGLTPFGSEQ